ncbi:MAG: MaoC family dehydratase N-terminal domain-containing protein [Dehalococcoidia bacterium]|nr:MaoC family dehydratase N-terminal domain-containing protein [Dehalococcoidia bacterium]
MNRLNRQVVGQYEYDVFGSLRAGSASGEHFIGRYFGQRAVDITPELVQQYCEAVGDFHPWYTGRSPFGGPVAPALILHSEVYRDLRWYLPNIYGNLHARQEWELYHPLTVGETATTSSVIVDRYVRRGRDYIVKEVSCYGADGRLLNRGRTHQSFLLETKPEGVVVDKEREKRTDRRVETDEGEVLEEFAGAEKHISLEMCQKFSGPHKNYHNDVEEARKLGFPDIVVQGMMSLCFLSELMTDRFGEGWYAGGRMNVNLVNVLWQGESVRCLGHVMDVVPSGAGRRAHVRVWCQKADGTKVVVGTASALTG